MFYFNHRECIKRASPVTMKLFSRRTDNGFYDSRQVSKCPANLVHGITGTKPAARYDSLSRTSSPNSDTPRILAEGH